MVIMKVSLQDRSGVFSVAGTLYIMFSSVEPLQGKNSASDACPWEKAQAGFGPWHR